MKIYWHNGCKNIIGKNVLNFRKQRGLTQKQLAEKLQLMGYEFSDLTILRIENGTRFVPDYEVKALSIVFNVTYEMLFD